MRGTSLVSRDTGTRVHTHPTRSYFTSRRKWVRSHRCSYWIKGWMDERRVQRGGKKEGNGGTRISFIRWTRVSREEPGIFTAVVKSRPIRVTYVDVASPFQRILANRSESWWIVGNSTFARYRVGRRCLADWNVKYSRVTDAPVCIGTFGLSLRSVDFLVQAPDPFRSSCRIFLSFYGKTLRLSRIFALEIFPPFSFHYRRLPFTEDRLFRFAPENSDHPVDSAARWRRIIRFPASWITLVYV